MPDKAERRQDPRRRCTYCSVLHQSVAFIFHALRLSPESILGREQGIWKSGLSRLPAKEVGSQGLAGSNPAIPARQPDMDVAAKEKGACRSVTAGWQKGKPITLTADAGKTAG